MGIKCYLGSDYLMLGDNDLGGKYSQLRKAFPRICPQTKKVYIELENDEDCQIIQNCLVPVHSECKLIVYSAEGPMIEAPHDVIFVPGGVKVSKSVRFDVKTLESFAKPTKGEVGLTKSKSCDFSQSGFKNLAKIMNHPGLPKHIAIVYDWNQDPQNTAMIPQRFSLDLSNAKDIESVNLNIWKGSGIEIALVLPNSAASLVNL